MTKTAKQPSPEDSKGDGRCFVICPIGAKGSDIRRRSDDIYHGLIEPVCAAFAIKPFRIIDDSMPGEITPKIVAAIYESELVIADITPLDGTPNPNVMYELALRHASGLPFIHISEETSRLPFDISSFNTIQIRGGFLGPKDTIDELSAHISSIRDGFANFENPVSRYHQKKKVQADGTPIEREMAELREEIALIRNRTMAPYVDPVYANYRNKQIDIINELTRPRHQQDLPLGLEDNPLAVPGTYSIPFKLRPNKPT